MHSTCAALHGTAFGELNESDLKRSDSNCTAQHSSARHCFGHIFGESDPGEVRFGVRSTAQHCTALLLVTDSGNPILDRSDSECTVLQNSAP